MWCWSKFRLKYSTILLSSVNSCSSAQLWVCVCVCVCVCVAIERTPASFWCSAGNYWGPAAYWIWNLLDFNSSIGCFRILGCIFCNKELEQHDGLAKETSLGRAYFHHCSAQPQHATANSSSIFVLLTLDIIRLIISLQVLQHHWSFVCQRVIHDTHIVCCGCPSKDLRPFFFDIRWECLGCTSRGGLEK